MTTDDFELLKSLVAVADKRADGHLTIMKFTTNWRVDFDTPADRDDINKMPAGKTFGQAARAALVAAATKEPG